MAASIFSKLSAQSRHKNIFSEAFDPNNPPANLRHANTLGKLAALNIRIQTTCLNCGNTDIHETKDLLVKHTPETSLGSIRPECSCCASTRVNTNII